MGALIVWLGLIVTVILFIRWWRFRAYRRYQKNKFGAIVMNRINSYVLGYTSFSDLCYFIELLNDRTRRSFQIVNGEHGRIDIIELSTGLIWYRTFDPAKTSELTDQELHERDRAFNFGSFGVKPKDKK